MVTYRRISELEYESRVTRAGLWALAGVILLAMGSLLQYLPGPISHETCSGSGYPTISQWTCYFTYTTSTASEISFFGFILLIVAAVQYYRVTTNCVVVRPHADENDDSPQDVTTAPQSVAPPAATITPPFCSACGAPVGAGARFCPSCGHART